MKETLGDFPLGVTSGLTPENVGDFLGCCDCLLVRMGVLEQPQRSMAHNTYRFSEDRLKAFVERVRQG